MESLTERPAPDGLDPSGAGAPDSAAAPDPRAERRGAVRTAVALVLVVLSVLALRAWVAAPTTVSSLSMEPTLARGQVVLVDKLSWRLGGIDRGEFVEFHGFHGQPMLKRMMAKGGDVVEIRDALLYVNGRRVPEPYVDHSRVDGLYYGPVTVPPGHYFMLGDNRGNSIDSRSYGPVPEADIVGTALVGLWPAGRLP